MAGIDRLPSGIAHHADGGQGAGVVGLLHAVRQLLHARGEGRARRNQQGEGALLHPSRHGVQRHGGAALQREGEHQRAVRRCHGGSVARLLARFLQLAQHGPAGAEAHVRDGHGGLGAAHRGSQPRGPVRQAARDPRALRCAQHHPASMGRRSVLRLRVHRHHVAEGSPLHADRGSPTRRRNGKLPGVLRLLRRQGRAVRARRVPAGNRGAGHQAAEAHLPADPPGGRQPVLGLLPPWEFRCSTRP